MPKNINLIPKESISKESTLKIVNSLRMIDTIGTLIFFIGVFFIISLIIINSEELRLSNVRQDKLKLSIRGLEKEEQQYVLLKDRADKIQKILSSYGAIKDMEHFNTLKNKIPSDVSITQLSVVRGSTETMIAASSYSSLAQTLAALLSSNLYKGIILNSFTFNIKSGYIISLKLTT